MTDLPERMPSRDELRTIPPAPVPAPDPFDALNVLEAAGYLEAMREAAELADEAGLDREIVDELEAERADARSLFTRKFFEVN